MSAVLRGRRPHWYTVAEAAQLLGEKPATIRKRCQRGLYPVKDASPGRGRTYQISGPFLRAELRAVGEVST